jgi:hypothetical protein
MIEAAKLEGHDGSQIAVTLRAATAAETFKLLCRAYALSERERQVVAALVAGLDTRAITQRLFISPYTVRTTSNRCSERPESAAAANCSHASVVRTRRHRQRVADAPSVAAPATPRLAVALLEERGTGPLRLPG